MASKSSQIRRKIGVVRKQLALAISSCIDGIRDNLHDYLPTASNEELLEHAELQESNHESLLTQLSKLEDLNKEWKDLMDKVNAYSVQQAANTSATSTDKTPSNTIPMYRPHEALLNPGQPTTTEHNAHLNYFDASLLTRLELPSFSGNIIEYPEFWARYHTLIHSKSTISNATKFSLLKSCLKGRALQTLDGPPITDANYGIAIDILKSTYDNPSTLRHLLYTQLSNIPQCDADGKQLQDIYLRMLRLVRQYTAITPDSPESGLGALLYNKLPRFVKSRIYDMNNGQKNLMPSELMDLLGEIVKKESTLRQMDTSSTHQPSYHSIQNHGPSQDAHNRQHDRYHSRTNSQGAPLRQYPFCQRTSHDALQCRTIQRPQERRNYAKAARMCLKCLKQGHQTINCSRRPCYKCKYHHHPALCYKTTDSRPTTSTQITNLAHEMMLLEDKTKQDLLVQHISVFTQPRIRAPDIRRQTALKLKPHVKFTSPATLLKKELHNPTRRPKRSRIPPCQLSTSVQPTIETAQPATPFSSCAQR